MHELESVQNQSLILLEKYHMRSRCAKRPPTCRAPLLHSQFQKIQIRTYKRPTHQSMPQLLFQDVLPFQNLKCRSWCVFEKSFSCLKFFQTHTKHRMTHQVQVLVALSNDLQRLDAEKVLDDAIKSMTSLFGAMGQLRGLIVAARHGKEHICAIVRFHDANIAKQVVDADVASLVLDLAGATIRAKKVCQVTRTVALRVSFLFLKNALFSRSPPFSLRACRKISTIQRRFSTKSPRSATISPCAARRTRLMRSLNATSSHLPTKLSARCTAKFVLAARSTCRMATTSRRSNWRTLT